jgi:hypothetical protein
VWPLAALLSVRQCNNLYLCLCKKTFTNLVVCSGVLIELNFVVLSCWFCLLMLAKTVECCLLQDIVKTIVNTSAVHVYMYMQ